MNMCIAVCGVLVEKEGSRGKVDVRGNRLSVELGIVEAKLGDYLLIHAGCAICVMSKQVGQELSDLLAQTGLDNG
jgi:hydrogenase expression/formation protein HypC